MITQFSEEEVNQFIDAYEKENAKRAKLTYKVKQYFPDKVVISLILRQSAWKRRF